jgi:hypothetical protein
MADPVTSSGAPGLISGPLLSQNLSRNGVNLSFDSDLIFMDVINRKIGIDKDSPGYDLDVNSTIHTTTLNVDEFLQIGNVQINKTGSISASVGKLNIGTANTVKSNRMITGNVQFKTNQIGLVSTVATGNTYFNPSSSQTNIGKDSLVNGSLHATGDITADGNIVLGNDQNTDTVNLQSQVTSDLIPNVDITYKLGKSNLRWNNSWTNSLTSTGITATNLTASDYSLFGNIAISANTIATLGGTNQDINLSPNSGLNFIEDILIYNDTITQTTTNSDLKFNVIGTGYYQISGSSGAQVPSGATSQRPVNPLLGMIRLNTQLGYLEVYNGSTWQSAIGETGAASTEQVNDQAVIWQLVLD